MRQDYTEDQPRCLRYQFHRLSSFVSVHLQLYNIGLNFVQFNPYDSHGKGRPFEWIPMYLRFIRFARITELHLPERVLRQYGYVQSIPLHPSVIVNKVDSIQKTDRH